jgi:acetyl esterase
MIDPELATVLESERQRGGRPYWELSPVEARKTRLPTAVDGDDLEVTDRTLVLPHNEGLPIRIYRPRNNLSSQPLPAVVFFHGGGWLMCDLDSFNGQVSALTRASDCVWISVDYRLAPEAKFPVGLYDCYEATQWVATYADELGIDRSRIAVAGTSAGGNLAAVVSLLARDQNDPPIALQALIYPVCDLSFEQESYVANAGYGLNLEAMQWFASHYLASADDRVDWRVSPLLAPSVEGLPRTLIVVAEHDVLRDEGLAYAARLKEGGTTVDLRFELGMIHGFWARPIRQARVSLGQVGGYVGTLLRCV